MKAKPIAFDWDGVLHANAHYSTTFGPVDLTLIDEAYERGYPVVISTANDTDRITAALRARGYSAQDDNVKPAGGTLRGSPSWHSARTILVTNRKPCAYAYVDDRGITHEYGQNTDKVWAQVREQITR
jgi:hypothetical protein